MQWQGTLLRTAHALGWQAAYLLPGEMYTAAAALLCLRPSLLLSCVITMAMLTVKRLSDVMSLVTGCCDPFNDKVLRAARGVPLIFPVQSGGWPQLQAVLQQHNLTCLAAHASDAGTPQHFADLLHATILSALKRA